MSSRIVEEQHTVVVTMTTIGFLHTAHAHALPFEALVAQLSPGVRVLTIVDEPLLSVARASGVDPAVAARRSPTCADRTTRART